MTYTAWFDEIRKDDIALAGGKGANLGELSTAGFPCRPASSSPPGRRFVESNDIGEEIVGAPRQPGRRTRPFEEVEGDPCAFPAARFRGNAHEIRAARRDERRRRAPARRQSTAEDLPGAASPASRTRTSTCASEALLEAVKNCWTSLWTARAMAYRARQGIDPATVSLAVVVRGWSSPSRLASCSRPTPRTVAGTR